MVRRKARGVAIPGRKVWVLLDGVSFMMIRRASDYLMWDWLRFF